MNILRFWLKLSKILIPNHEVNNLKQKLAEKDGIIKMHIAKIGELKQYLYSRDEEIIELKQHLPQVTSSPVESVLQQISSCPCPPSGPCPLSCPCSKSNLACSSQCGCLGACYNSLATVKAEVRHSLVEGGGNGCFASRDIQAGELIQEYTGSQILPGKLAM